MLSKLLAPVVALAITLAPSNANAQANTTGTCSPAFSQSRVIGNVTVTCGVGRKDLEAIAATLSQMSQKNGLDRGHVDRLLALINEIIALSPQIARIDRNSNEATVNTRDILQKLQQLATGPTQGAGIIKQVESWKPPQPPVKVDPNTFVRRLPGQLGLKESGWCRLSPQVPADGSSPEYKNLVKLGSVFLQDGRYSEAIDHYRQAAKLSPRDPVAYYNIGVTECSARRYPEALSALQQAAETAPRNSAIVIAQAILQFRLKNYRETVNKLRTAAQLSPKAAEIPDGEGTVWAKLDNRAAAITAFSAAISIDPLYSDAYIHRAQARLDSGDAVGAVADYLVASNLSPDSSSIRRSLAHAYRVLAADPGKSLQTDYRSYAEKQESIARAMEKDYAARSDVWYCVVNYHGAGEPISCQSNRYTVYFDRNSDYLTAQAKKTMIGMLEQAQDCGRITIEVRAFADQGEDEFSSGKDLSQARAHRVQFPLTQVLSGVLSVSMTALGMTVTGKFRNAPTSIGYMAMGHTELPVQGTHGPEARNQVVDLILSCGSAAPHN